MTRCDAPPSARERFDAAWQSRAGGWAEINTQPDGSSTTLAQEFRSLAEHMNDEQISEAKRSAREFLKSYVWSWSAGNGA